MPANIAMFSASLNARGPHIGTDASKEVPELVKFMPMSRTTVTLPLDLNFSDLPQRERLLRMGIYTVAFGSLAVFLVRLVILIFFFEGKPGEETFADFPIASFILTIVGFFLMRMNASKDQGHLRLGPNGLMVKLPSRPGITHPVGNIHRVEVDADAPYSSIYMRDRNVFGTIGVYGGARGMHQRGYQPGSGVLRARVMFGGQRRELAYRLKLPTPRDLRRLKEVLAAWQRHNVEVDLTISKSADASDD
jgi:hypothetical protein